MITNIRHTGYTVLDLKKSIEFYKKLGFKVLETGTIDSETFKTLYGLYIPLEYCKLVSVDMKGILELYSLSLIDMKSRFNHISVSVKDINSAWKFFKQKKLLLSKKIVELNSHKLFFACDLDQNTLEIVEPPRG